MPHLSKQKLSRNTEKTLTSTFDKLFVQIKRDENMEVFLNSLLTSTERVMLAKRLAIAVLLHEGFSHAQISKILHVTRMTVYKYESFLNKKGTGFNIAFSQMAQDHLMQEFRSTLLGIAEKVINSKK